MLFNPYAHAVVTIPGSRVLVEHLGLLGASIHDPKNHQRIWTVSNVYAPLPRALGGIRVKLEDQKGFVTFCNQRDFELFLGLAKPGNLCPWTNKEYPEFTSKEFYGLCADDEDLIDDLFDREMGMRAECVGVIPFGTEVYRRVHVCSGSDYEELSTMLYDCDDSGYGPDPRLETISRRWSRVERNRLRWDAL